MVDIEFWIVFVIENSTNLQKLVLKGEMSSHFGPHGTKTTLVIRSLQDASNNFNCKCNCYKL